MTDEHTPIEMAAVRLSLFRLSTQNEPFSGVAAPWEDELVYLADAVNRLRAGADATLASFLRYAVAGTGPEFRLDEDELARLTGFAPEQVAPVGTPLPAGSTGGIVALACLHRDSHDRFCGGLAFRHLPEDDGLLRDTLAGGVEPFARAALERFVQAGHCLGIEQDSRQREVLTPIAYWQLHFHPRPANAPRTGQTILDGYRRGEPAYRRAAEPKLD